MRTGQNPALLSANPQAKEKEAPLQGLERGCNCKTWSQRGNKRQTQALLGSPPGTARDAARCPAAATKAPVAHPEHGWGSTGWAQGGRPQPRGRRGMGTSVDPAVLTREAPRNTGAVVTRDDQTEPRRVT